MSVKLNSILQSNSCFAVGGNDDFTTIGVAANPNGKLSPTEILLRAVMSALGTDKREAAEDFIHQLEIKPKDLPLLHKNGISLYEFPVDANFYNAVNNFKATGNVNAQAIETKTSNGNGSTTEISKPGDIFNAQQGIVRTNNLNPKIQIPEKLSAAYQKFLAQNNVPDGDATRSRFLNLMKTDATARARYTPLNNQGTQAAKILRQQEANNRAVAAQINEGHNLRFGKTERKTQFSAVEQQLYNKALIAYQAQDSQEFASAFRQGKLLNLETFVRKMDAAQKEATAQNGGESILLVRGTAEQPKPINPRLLSQTELAIFKSVQFQQAERTGKDSNLFQIAGKDQLGAIRRGADMLDRTAFFNAEGLDKLPDARREMFRRALTGSGLGYDAQTIETYLNNLQQKDNVKLRWRGDSTFDFNKDKIASKDEINAYVTDLVGGKKIGEFTIDAGSRLELAVTEARLTGDEQTEFKITYENERIRAEREFDKKRTGSLLIDGLKALDMHNKLSEYGDKLNKQIFSGTEDYRQNGTFAEQMANRTADQIEKDVKDSLDSNPLLSSLSEDVKNRVVDFYVGIERGTTRLAASIDGIGMAANDLAKDALIASMEKVGYDMTAYKAQVQAERKSPERQAIAEYYRANAAMDTKRTQIEEIVYQTKRDLNIRTTVMDLPSFSRSVGESVPQMLPQLAVGAATGGSSLVTQIAINAAISGALAGGESYQMTNGDRAASSNAAIFGAVNGAMIPLGNRLGISGDAAINIGSTVITGKLQNLSDDEIVNSMIQQAGGIAAFKVGGGLNSALAKLRNRESLPPPEAARVLFEESTKGLEISGKTQYGKLSELAAQMKATVRLENGKLTIEVPAQIKQAATTAAENYGKNNRVITKQTVETVNQALRPNDLQMNMLVIPPALAKATIKAAYHAEGGLRAFGEFVGELRKAHPDLKFNDAEAAAAYRIEAAKSGATIDEAAMNAESLKRTAPQEMPDDLIKIRETFTDGHAREAFDVQYLESINKPKGIEQFRGKIIGFQRSGDLAGKLSEMYQNGVVRTTTMENARTVITDPAFLNSPAVKTAMAVKPNDRLNKVRSEVAIELTRQQLAKQYPAADGYRILSEVQIYEDTGFATIIDWQKAHPGQKPSGLKEINGRAMRGTTDIDLLVIKDVGNGKPSEIVQMEQIKSGGSDASSEAQKQVDKSIRALQSGAAGNSVVLQIGTIDVTNQIKMSSVDTAKQVTRGPEGKNFDQSIGLSAYLLDQLTKEIIK